jgi:hypothetical protein
MHTFPFKYASDKKTPTLAYFELSVINVGRMQNGCYLQEKGEKPITCPRDNFEILLNYTSCSHLTNPSLNIFFFTTHIRKVRFDKKKHKACELMLMAKLLPT